MKQVWVRPADEKDIPKLEKWLKDTANNLFDPDVLTYPQTTILAAHDTEPIVYMPVQIAAVLESLAVRPGASPLEFASAIKELIKTVAFLSKTRGIHELYFVSKDENVNRLAAKHGFEEVPWKLLRLKLDKLETNDLSQ